MTVRAAPQPPSPLRPVRQSAIQICALLRFFKARIGVVRRSSGLNQDRFPGLGEAGDLPTRQRRNFYDN
jgi:hypothetical protein